MAPDQKSYQFAWVASSPLSPEALEIWRDLLDDEEIRKHADRSE
jgi:hypothetical protein